MDMNLGDTQLILDACKKHGLLRNQAAYVLATAYWETARTMKPVVEAFWLSEGWRRRNLRYYPWHGRGYVQLTWEFNYKRATKELGVDFLENPELALEPKHSAEITVIGMKEGWFTKKKLSTYVNLHKSDFVKARYVVNGKDKRHEIAAIAKEYDRILLDLGYGVEQVPVVQDKPLSKSRTIRGGGAAAAGGVAVLVEPVKEATAVFNEQQDAMTSGSWIAIAIGAVILAGAVATLYARWDDAGRPKPW